MRTRLLIAALLLWVIPAFATTVSGRVVDSEGAAIKGARVLIHWDPSGSQVGVADNVGIKDDMSVLTKEDGSFSLDVPPGFYDVFVSALTFSPECTKVRTKADKPAEVHFKLKVSRIVSAELD